MRAFFRLPTSVHRLPVLEGALERLGPNGFQQCQRHDSREVQNVLAVLAVTICYHLLPSASSIHCWKHREEEKNMSQDSHIFPRCVKGPRADLFAKPMGQTAECGIRLPIVAPKRLNCKCCSRNRQLDRVGAVGAHTSRPHFQ